MDNNSKITRKRREEPKTPSYKYSFRLNEEQNIRFNRMLSDAGQEHNRSRFIVKRIFAERFEVLKRDPTNVQFMARLNDFYYQFQRIGNNYNQIVKAVNAHFSNHAMPRQIAALELADVRGFEEEQQQIKKRRKRIGCKSAGKVFQPLRN